MSRRRCLQCHRPISTCLCKHVRRVVCPLDVIVLQDPKEARHAMSTAPLLAMSIVGARVEVGEVFDPVALFGPLWQQQSLLIYPAEATVPCAEAGHTEVRRLLLLDGTWRKVRRLIHLNPWLTALPRLSLAPQQPSRYRIRKSPRTDGLSTIEAGVAALNQLFPAADYTPVLEVFTAMVDVQIAAMGSEAAKNHPV